MQVGQRKFVLLFLFMASQGGGVVSGKLIMAAARRLRVTYAASGFCLVAVACVTHQVPVVAQNLRIHGRMP